MRICTNKEQRNRLGFSKVDSVLLACELAVDGFLVYKSKNIVNGISGLIFNELLFSVLRGVIGRGN
jgi:hypothetical protein